MILAERGKCKKLNQTTNEPARKRWITYASYTGQMKLEENSAVRYTPLF